MSAAKRTTRREPQDSEASVLFIRNVPPHVMSALDAWAAELTDERGSSVTRTDLVREILHRAVQDRARKGAKT
jgi:hypothetical protein